MKKLKSIDAKSLIIGALLTSTIFLGVAATSPTDRWDKNQVWLIKYIPNGGLKAEEYVKEATGWEPIHANGVNVMYRQRAR